MPSVDDLLDLLSSDPVNGTDILVPLPDYLFPTERQPSYPSARIHHSYLPAMESHGTRALIALLDLIESPPTPAPSSVDTFTALLRPFSPRTPIRAVPITNVEIVGHGLGAAIGLLVATALHLEVTGPAAQEYARPLTAVNIRSTLFSSPRVGDEPFAQWIDDLSTPARHAFTSHSNFQVHRVTSFGDTVTHLPERHLELAHPSRGEIWVGADPRVAFACVANAKGEESEECSAGVKLSKTSLLDHAGPFGGVWIGGAGCRSHRSEGL
jgi:hypothetical protein